MASDSTAAAKCPPAALFPCAATARSPQSDCRSQKRLEAWEGDAFRQHLDVAVATAGLRPCTRRHPLGAAACCPLAAWQLRWLPAVLSCRHLLPRLPEKQQKGIPQFGTAAAAPVPVLRAGRGEQWWETARAAGVYTAPYNIVGAQRMQEKPKVPRCEMPNRRPRSVFTLYSLLTRVRHFINAVGWRRARRGGRLPLGNRSLLLPPPAPPSAAGNATN